MLQGQRIYQDFLQFTPPGTDLLYFVLFRSFGPRLWLTNAVVLTLGLVFVWLIYSTALQLMPPGKAALASTLFLVPVYGSAINSTHHWFAVLAVLAAIRTLFPGRTPARVAAAGLLLGLASFFSLYHGAAALVAAVMFCVIENRSIKQNPASPARDVLLAVSAYLLTLATLSAPYIFSLGIRQLWYFQVSYVCRFTIHPQIGYLFGLPSRLGIHTLPSLATCLIVYLLLPAGAFASLYICWTYRSNLLATQPAALLLSFTALLLLAEVAVNVNWLRLFAVSAPAVILVVWSIHRSSALRKVASIALWAWLLVQGSQQTFRRQQQQNVLLKLPAGTVATSPKSAVKLTRLAQRLQPGDKVFQAVWPGIYLPLDLQNPVYFDTVCSDDMPSPSDIELVILQLDKQHVPYVLLGSTPNAVASAYCVDRLSPLRAYLHAAYIPVETLSDGDILWQRNAAAGEVHLPPR